MNDNVVTIPMIQAIRDYSERIFIRAILYCFVITIGIILLVFLIASGIIVFMGNCGKNSKFYGVINCTI